MSTQARLVDFSLEFIHVGAKCPACGHVYTRGFSSLMIDHNKHTATAHPLGALTLCTRCRRVLAIADAGLVQLSEVDVMMLSDVHRAGLDVVKQLLDATQRDVH